MTKIITILVIFGMVLGAQVAFAQCENVSGYAKASCLAQSKLGNAIGVPTPGVTTAQKAGSFTTSFADALHSATPASVPAQFDSLFKLERTQDGGIILKPGAYEAYVQAFFLDPGDLAPAQRMEGYLPAPEKGSRTAALRAALKQNELHPEIPQLYVQAVIFAVVGEQPVSQWDPQLQQFAGAYLGSDVMAQLDGPAQGAGNAALKQKALTAVIGAINRNPKFGGATGGIQRQIGTLDTRSGGMASAGIDILTGAFGKKKGGAAAASTASVPRDTWALMPEGYYVRYLTDMQGVHLQVLVPDSAASKVFDPTQYVAVYSGTPAQRLGISLRPVEQ